ncbi:hypothetical protein BN2476_40049 [Paraburkholderia piptadeniae]|uniref:Uncharacterized protein n=1 Tax=Paraburkholderia piptadeniae TaxID=1701573 RepID=A0A1N7RK83_9BURK|nr:hypothetical protein BN2476_40049 [Paraburkholderia piptadeniae]
MHAERAKDHGQMDLDRPLGDAEIAGDHLVGPAAMHEAHDFLLTRRQVFEQMLLVRLQRFDADGGHGFGWRGYRRLGGGDCGACRRCRLQRCRRGFAVAEQAQRFHRHVRAAGKHQFDRLEHHARGLAFRHEAERARREHGAHLVGRLFRGQHHDGQRRVGCQQVLQRRGARHAGHMQIDDREIVVGVGLGDGGQRFPRVGFVENGVGIESAQQPFDTLADQFMIVGYEKLHHVSAFGPADVVPALSVGTGAEGALPEVRHPSARLRRARARNRPLRAATRCTPCGRVSNGPSMQQQLILLPTPRSYA